MVRPARRQSRRAGRAAVVALGALALVLVVGVDRASAEPLPGVTHCPECADPAKGARVVNWFLEQAYRGGSMLPDYIPPDASPPVGQPPSWWATQAADDVAASTARSQAATTGGRALAGETLSAGRLAGLFPKVPTIFAGAAAFTGGWLIGTSLRGLFFEENVAAPPGDYFNSSKLQAVDKGDFLFTDPGGSVPVYAPAPGWLLTWNGTTTTELFADEAGGTCGRPGGPGGAFAPLDSVGYNNICSLGPAPVWPWYIPGSGVRRGYFLSAASQTPSTPLRPFDPLTDGSPTGLGSANAPSRETLAAALPDVLNANPTLTKWLRNRVGGAGADPTVDTITLSDCDGLTFIECRDALQALGVLGTIRNNTLGRSGAVLSKSAGKVTRTEPEVGSVVLPADDVDVYTNPDPLPVLLPAPASRETRTSYLARLTTLGLVEHNVVTLTDSTLDPRVGPDEVASTSPAPGSRVFPDETVTVRVNPETAPEPLPGGGGGVGQCGPNVPPIDLEPINQDVGGKFPFGVFAWLLGALGGWTGGGEAPRLVIPIHGDELVVDFAQLEPAMEVVRPVILVLSLLSLGWLFASSALGFGSAPSSED